VTTFSIGSEISGESFGEISSEMSSYRHTALTKIRSAIAENDITREGNFTITNILVRQTPSGEMVVDTQKHTVECGDPLCLAQGEGSTIVFTRGDFSWATRRVSLSEDALSEARRIFGVVPTS